jgi:hypothetical protein
MDDNGTEKSFPYPVVGCCGIRRLPLQRFGAGYRAT